MKGVIAMALLGLVIAFQRLGVKYLYDEYVDLEVLHLLIYRVLIAFAVNVLWVNARLKEEMFTLVHRDLLCPLITKVFHAMAG